MNTLNKYFGTCRKFMLITLYLMDSKDIKMHKKEIPSFDAMYSNSFLCSCSQYLHKNVKWYLHASQM